MKYPFICPECAGPLNTPGCEGTPVAAGSDTYAQALFRFKCVCGADGTLTAMWSRPPKKEVVNESMPDVQPAV